MKHRPHNFIKKAFMFTAACLAALLMAGSASPAFALYDPGDGRTGEPIMVSFGDSYSSGEGVEPFYYSERADRYTQPDWLAHRSRLSWPGKLQLPDGRGNRLVMAQNKAFYSNKTKSYDSFSKNNWYFVASSGAVTGSLRGTQNKTFDHDPSTASPLDHNTVTLDNQLKVFDSIAPGTTDYVTMTMGGNDAHFADVFVYAAFNCSFLNVNGMDDYLNNIWDEFYNGSRSIKNRLIRAYNDIHTAAGNQADIIIAGYPKILPKNGFLIFSAKEAKSINTAITKLNNEMQSIVQSLQAPDFKIHFVSVEKAFEGHEIYTGTFNEYLNGIKFVTSDDLEHTQMISSYSLHPNSKGVKAYAACVQQCIDQIEEEKAQNNPIVDNPDTDEGSGETTAQPQAVAFSSEGGAISALSGEQVQIPVDVWGNAPMKCCSLQFEYDSEVLQIDSVTSAELCEDSVESSIDAADSAVTVNWSSLDSAVGSGTLFYLNATVLKADETVIRVSDDAANATDKYGRSLTARCADITFNPAGGVGTLTVDLSELSDLEGAFVMNEENSLFTASADTGEGYALASFETTKAQNRICFYKPGYTRLYVVIDHITAGETIDLTATLKKAAAERPLLSMGDVDGDGCVGFSDVSQLLSTAHYGLAVDEAQPGFDLDGDGMISLEDIAIILSADNYGAADLTLSYEAPCA
ncbi:MAG: hypothetical protein IJI67_01970 [Clostridia bacterium]|nr:hypothetical protein [Clostridia bacterium]